MEYDYGKTLIDNLKSNNTNDVFNALLKIRKGYGRNAYKMKSLQKYSVIEFIVPLLEHPKYCSISLSIIADCCLELDFVQEVIKWDGIKSLIRIMKSLVNDDVRNRACRALGNIARFDIGYKAIHLMNPVSNISNFLSETKNVNCQQTAIRTLMILGKTSKSKELIARESGIIHTAKLLHSSNVDVLIYSIKALSSFTKNSSIFCARQLSELQFLRVIVQLYAHSQIKVRNHALITLKNLSIHEEIRSSLVKVGALKLFTEILLKLESHEMSRLAALALCNCLDHIHMWSNYGVDRAHGLKSLLVVLQNENFKSIHLHVISSLIPLTYESKITEILISLNILPILIQVLSSFIEKNKCQFRANPALNLNFYSVNDALSNIKKVTESENETAELQFQMSEICFPTSKEANVDSGNCFSEDNGKIPVLWDNNTYSPKVRPSFKSSTSDYSSSSSPSRLCSPILKLSTSPEAYEFSDGSPSGYSSNGVWSPVSPVKEYIVPYAICWSPVVSLESNSSTEEEDFLLDDFSADETSQLSSSPMNCSLSSSKLIDRNNIIEFGKSSSADCNLFMSTESNTVHDELSQMCKRKNDFNKSTTAETPSSNKRLKTENSSVEVSKVCCLSSTLTTEVLKSDDFGENQHLNLQLSSESTEKQGIDHCVILFILQLSFHLEKKPNSPVADKNCFSKLIDYLCFIHNPSPKAETILLNLVKNRYCFEKLVLNGFVSEIEEKMAYSNYACVHRSKVNFFFYNLVNIGKQEAASDYVIGTLSHILVTSEKIGQLHAICTMSKLVTDKSALHRLLFQANGMSLLLNFLLDSCILTHRKAISSLCEIYQSLIKEQVPHVLNKCCLFRTCGMKISDICCYKKSCYNVTFSVDSGAKILANREKLCENSAYFNALLEGHFLETTAKSVTLSDISAETLSTIFHFLHGCGLSACCPYIKRIPFSVLLELLSECDRFLLMNIKTFVEDRLCHCLFPSTVPKIYKKSKIHNSPLLANRSLDFALSLNIVQKDTLWNCFEELINLESNLKFSSDIENLLKNMF